MKNDIQDRADIEMMVNTFYGKVRESIVLGYIFDNVAQVNWESHLPRMYSFWASVLLDEQSYSGNTMHKHLELKATSKNSFSGCIAKSFHFTA